VTSVSVDSARVDDRIMKRAVVRTECLVRELCQYRLVGASGRVRIALP
jgi:hypothetical protein